MGLLINLGSKISGAWAFIMDWLPVLGAVGSILAVGGSILIRASLAHDAAGVFQTLHPTLAESGAISLAVGLIKAHLNHQDNKAAIEANK